MKLLITIALASGLSLTAFGAHQAQGTPKSDSIKVARAVKLYIAAEHKKRGTDAKTDFAKMHKVCGKAQGWTKGCRFWKSSGGKDKFMFQKGVNGKIYGVPSYLLKD